jgi:hypothetical protein
MPQLTDEDITTTIEGAPTGALTIQADADGADADGADADGQDA